MAAEKKASLSSWADETEDFEAQQKNTKPANAWGQGNPLTGGARQSASQEEYVNDSAFPSLGTAGKVKEPRQPSRSPEEEYPRRDRRQEEFPQRRERRYDDRFENDRRFNNNRNGDEGFNHFGRERHQKHYDREPLPFPTEPPYTAYVGNLPYEIREDDLQHFLANCKISNIRMISKNGRPKGFAYVEFEDPDSLREAVSRSGEQIFEREIKIDVATGRQQDRQDRPFERGWRDRPVVEANTSQERKRIELKPRSVEGLPKDEMSDAYKNKTNPFGNAQPREKVLQSRPELQNPQPISQPISQPATQQKSSDKRPQRNRGRSRNDRIGDREKTWERGSGRQREENRRNKKDSRPQNERQNRSDRPVKVEQAAPVYYLYSHC